MRRIPLVLAAVALAGLGQAQPRAEPRGVHELLGTFVGRASDDPALGRKNEQRDIIMEIESYQQQGLRLRWNNVTLVDGRRDVPGVRFRRDEMILVPAPDRSFFLAGLGYDPFALKKELDALQGDPLRWGAVRGETLDVYSFVVLADGTYELQVSSRSPAGDGVRLEFERIVDGEVVRLMSGHTVRAD